MSLARCSKAYCSSQSTDVNDVLIVGVELAALAELDELLEVGDLAVRALVLLRGALDRAREVVELDLIVADVERVGDARA